MENPVALPQKPVETKQDYSEAPVAKQPKAAAKAKAATEQAVEPTEAPAESESEDSKADKDKPSRPRRPRGRPPKKANPVAE